jgi:hypothetical protein
LHVSSLLIAAMAAEAGPSYMRVTEEQTTDEKGAVAVLGAGLEVVQQEIPHSRHHVVFAKIRMIYSAQRCHPKA